jgi:hypothetical protein
VVVDDRSGRSLGRLPAQCRLGLVAGEANTLLRYDGSSWQPILIDTITDFTGVWGSTANNVFLVSNDRSGKILHRCGPAW